MKRSASHAGLYLLVVFSLILSCLPAPTAAAPVLDSALTTPPAVSAAEPFGSPLPTPSATATDVLPAVTAVPSVTMTPAVTSALPDLPTPPAVPAAQPFSSPLPTPEPGVSPEDSDTPIQALTIQADPPLIEPGQVATFTVVIHNPGIEPWTGLLLEDTLPDGLVYASSSGVDFSYEPGTRRLQSQPPTLAAGQTLTATFQARVTGLAMGDELTTTITARAEGLAGPLSADAVLDVAPPAADAAWVSAESGGWLHSPDHRLLLRVPPGAVARRTRITYTPLAQFPNPEGNPSGIRITSAFRLEALDEDGQPVTQFAVPLALIYRHPAAQRDLAPDSALFYWDEAAQRWRSVPSQADERRGRLQARLEHFTDYGQGANVTPPPAPGITGIQAQLFSGSLNVDYPMEVPPGPGGLAPALGLSYSSADLAGKGHTQTAGWGWSLPLASYIMRNPDKYWEYILVLNGVSHELLPEGPALQVYRSKQDPYLRVLRTADQTPDYVNTSGEIFRPSGFAPATFTFNNPTYQEDKQGWLITTQDGTQYAFTPALYIRRCDVNFIKHRFDTWVLKRIQRLNNTIDFSYSYEASYTNGGCDNDLTGDQLTGEPVGGYYMRAATLKRVTYGVGGRFAIDFETVADRSDRPPSFDDIGRQVFWTRNRLRSVAVRVDGALARKYVLDSHWAGAGGTVSDDREWLLDGITQWNTNETIALPRTTYLYDTDRIQGGVRYGTLEKVQNGYGGSAEYVYDYNQCQQTVWRCPVIEERRSGGGTDPTVVTRYAYPSGWDATAKGYSQAKVTLVGSRSPDADVYHYFHTDSVKKGREYKSETYQGTTLLARSEQQWLVRNIFSDVNFVYLAEQSQSDVGPTAVQARRVGYKYEDYGNVLAEYQYGDSVIVPNGGFEDGISGWQHIEACYEHPDDTHQPPCVADVTTGEPPLLGLGRIGMHTNRSSGGGVYRDVTGLTPGVRYVIRAQVRGTEPANVADFQLWVHDGPQGLNWAATQVHPTSAWQTVEVGFTATDSRTVRIHLQYVNLIAGQERTLVVDDVYIKPAESVGDERSYHRGYYPNTTSGWIVDRLAYENVYSGISYENVGGAALKTQTINYYDHQTSYWLPPTNGQLTTYNYGGADGAFSQVRYAYDSCGNQTTVTDANSNATTSEYEHTYWAYPVTVTNAKNQSTTLTWDYVKSRLTTVRDDANDATTRYEYDTFGRVIKTYRPYDVTWPTQEYQYTDPYTSPDGSLHGSRMLEVLRETNTVGGDVRPIFHFYDGLGREVQVRAEKTNGSTQVVTDSTYDARGRRSVAYVPVEQTYGDFQRPAGWNGRPGTTTQYDVLDRVVRVTNPDNSVVQTGYDGWQTLVLDANGHQTLRQNGVSGQPVKVKEYGGTYAGPTWSATPSGTTTYRYDVMEHLTDVWDAANNHTSMTYDSRGRKTSMTDPDMGHWVYTYDAAGNLTKQTDARGTTVSFIYDKINQLEEKRLGDASGVLLAKNVYDEAGHGSGTGRRTQMNSYDSSGLLLSNVSWTYDKRGRVTEERRAINDGAGMKTFVTQWAYDSADRVISTKYPDGNQGQLGETVSTQYNDQWLPKTLSSSYTNGSGVPDYYVKDATYNALGQPTQITQETPQGGVVTRLGYYGLGGQWDNSPSSGVANYGRLWRSRSRQTSGVPLLDYRYDYDPAGNLKRVVEAPRQTSNWPTSGFLFQDNFDSKNASAWVWNANETVPYNSGGNNVVRTVGTDVDWTGSFYRSSFNLVGGRGFSLRFQLSDVTTSQAMFYAESTTDGIYRRFGVYVNNGKLSAQVNDTGAGAANYRYPADLITAMKANVWYELRIALDESGRGFYLEVQEAGNPSTLSSYNYAMLGGKQWRFCHALWHGSSLTDDYREFYLTSLTWTPFSRIGYSYDALDRLTGGVSENGSEPYSKAWQYSQIGNLTLEDNLLTYDYTNAAHMHAVTQIRNGSTVLASYQYDANGNMTQRSENGQLYQQTWDSLNQLSQVTVGGQGTTYGYDGDGQLVRAVRGSTVTLYVGTYYEQQGSTITKYYYLGGRRVAMRRGTVTSPLNFLLGDYLGSTQLATAANGQPISGAATRYQPYGAIRSGATGLPTERRFTGQLWDGSTGLYQMGARWYDPYLNRFISPDTIVPEPGNPQALNRYAFVLNNPLRYIDPSGHAPMFPGQSLVAAAAVAAETVDPLPADPLVWALAADMVATDPIWQLAPQWAAQAQQGGVQLRNWLDKHGEAGSPNPGKNPKFLRNQPLSGEGTWRRYQEFVTGKDYEEVYQLSNGRQVHLDGINERWVVEAKWAGQNAATYRSSPYNPASRYFNPSELLDQMSRQIQFAQEQGLNGVRWAVSNEAAQADLAAFFQQHFGELYESGFIRVWCVPGNGM